VLRKDGSLTYYGNKGNQKWTGNYKNGKKVWCPDIFLGNPHTQKGTFNKDKILKIEYHKEYKADTDHQDRHDVANRSIKLVTAAREWLFFFLDVDDLAGFVKKLDIKDKLTQDQIKAWLS